LELVKEVREATGPNFVIIFRISLLDLVDGGGMTFDEAVDLAMQLQDAGVSVLNTGVSFE
jgi:2,4-dienoyl-CoA reductase (NADPH2)